MTSSSGSRRSRNARASGRAAASSCVSRPTSFPSHQRAASGNESSRSVSPVGRAVDDDHVPLARLDVALEPQQAEQLVAAGRDGQLLGGDPLHAALDQHLPEPALHRGPVPLELDLRGHLLRPQVRRQLGRLVADRRLEHVGERVRRIGGEHDRAQARRRRSGGRWRRRPTSCRRRPCPCRGSCAGPSTAPSLLRGALALRLEHLDGPLDARRVAGEVGRVDADDVVAACARGTSQLTVRVPRPTVPAATDSTRSPSGAVTVIVAREIFESEKRSTAVGAAAHARRPERPAPAGSSGTR